jgi:precorrin-2 dehydrogenase/sirohydrochlorin ferrochelatase
VAYSYPILLDLSGKLVVIVGGGGVAVRKAKTVLDGGATPVRCIAPEIQQNMPHQVQQVIARFEPSQLEGAYLVFAATDSAEINFDVVRAARERKILVSRVDSEEDRGDFVLPAVWRRGEITISVSSGIPSLSAWIRDEIRDTLSSIDQYEQMAELMQKLRPWLYNSSLPSIRQACAMIDLASKQAMEVLAASGGDGLYRWLVERYPELKLEKAP